MKLGYGKHNDYSDARKMSRWDVEKQNGEYVEIVTLTKEE